MKTGRMLADADSTLDARRLRKFAVRTVSGGFAFGLTVLGGYGIGQQFSPPAAAATTTTPGVAGAPPMPANPPSSSGRSSDAKPVTVVPALQGLTVTAARSKVPKGVAFLVRYVNTPAKSDAKIASQSPSPGARSVKTITVVVRAPLITVPIRSVLKNIPSPEAVRIRSHSYPDGFTAALPFSRSIPSGISMFDASIWVPAGGSRRQLVVRDGARLAVQITLTPGVERKVAVPILEGQRLSIESTAGSAAPIYIANADFQKVAP